MVRLHTAGLVVLSLALITNTAAAQTVAQPFGTPRLSLGELPPLAAQSPAPRGDSLVNGTLIGLGAGLGAAFALHKTFDALLCEAPGGCETPWNAYLLFGGIGAGAGAGIDFLIGRNASPRTAALSISPIIGPARQGVRASLRLPQRGSLPSPARARQGASAEGGDSVWNGTLLGAGLGAGGGYVWARNQCSHDTECFAIAGTVGILGGAGIGAAVGAIADALHR